MKKNKHLLIGLMSVLILIITIHVALFVKYADGRLHFCNAGVTTINESMQWFQPIFSLPLQPAPGGT
jgi:hypothetical protein